MTSPGEAGSSQVVDRDVVGAAERIEVDVLNATEVHGDVGNVAREQHPVAVGRDVDVLADIGPVEQQRVCTRATFDGVAAVAWVPDEGVIACTHREPSHCRARR